MENLKIRLIRNKKELNQVLKIREIVFIKGQKVPVDRERDGLDNISHHFIVLFEDKPIGCARIRFIKGNAKLERIALLKKYRGKGFGKTIVDYLVKYCIRKNAKEIVMGAQHYLKNFYMRCGFKPRGRIFMDAGIKHVERYIKPKLIY